LRFGATPVINTIGTLFVAVTMSGMLLLYLLQKKTKTGA
jgi:ABC-type spermidine/putrescine transport system permease subunit II